MGQTASSQIAAQNLSTILFSLAEVNPFFAEILETAAIDVQQRARQTNESDASSVLHAIRRLDCWTVQDISEETKFSPRKVRRLLRVLVSRNEIYFLRAPLTRQQRGGNRKLLYYLPVGYKIAQSKIKTK